MNNTKMAEQGIDQVPHKKWDAAAAFKTSEPTVPTRSAREVFGGLRDRLGRVAAAATSTEVRSRDQVDFGAAPDMTAEQARTVGGVHDYTLDRAVARPINAAADWAAERVGDAKDAVTGYVKENVVDPARSPRSETTVNYGPAPTLSSEARAAVAPVVHDPVSEAVRGYFRTNIIEPSRAGNVTGSEQYGADTDIRMTAEQARTVGGVHDYTLDRAVAGPINAAADWAAERVGDAKDAVTGYVKENVVDPARSPRSKTTVDYGGDTNYRLPDNVREQIATADNSHLENRMRAAARNLFGRVMGRLGTALANASGLTEELKQERERRQKLEVDVAQLKAEKEARFENAANGRSA